MYEADHFIKHEWRLLDLFRVIDCIVMQIIKTILKGDRLYLTTRILRIKTINFHYYNTSRFPNSPTYYSNRFQITESIYSKRRLSLIFFPLEIFPREAGRSEKRKRNCDFRRELITAPLLTEYKSSIKR